MQEQADALQEELAALRAQKDDAQREFDYIMEQTQLDLDDEEASDEITRLEQLLDELVGLVRFTGTPAPRCESSS